jgi:putative ABC transport system substrate-binding protein
MIRRREFIAGLGYAAAWPLVARAQQGDRLRRIGVLLPATADDTQYQTLLGVFLQELALSGWTIGRNVRIDTRWATANVAEIRRHATELATLAPDVVGAMAPRPWRRCCRRPALCRSCFRSLSIRSPLVSSTAWRGRAAMLPVLFLANTASGGKRLELLKQVAPALTRVAVLREHPGNAVGHGG